MATPKRTLPKIVTTDTEEDVFNLELSSQGQTLQMLIQDGRAAAQSRPSPALLYHYTTAAGLLGIIENNKLWATHISYLNDASELSYARQLVENLLERHQQKAATLLAREFFRRARMVFDVSQTMDVFISCFCEDGDLLSQWRGYAQAGEGYSIGVDGDQFGKIGSGKNFFFGPVEYDRERQEQIVEGIIELLLEGLAKMAGSLNKKRASARIDECCRIFRRVIWYPLVTFKHPMFTEENEWRLIEIMPRKQTEEKVRFRASGSKLLPYVDLDFSKFELPSGFNASNFTSPGKIPIRQVFHGPTLNPELSARVLRLLLAKNGYSDAEVRGSKIPLRL